MSRKDTSHRLLIEEGLPRPAGLSEGGAFVVGGVRYSVTFFAEDDFLGGQVAFDEHDLVMGSGAVYEFRAFVNEGAPAPTVSRFPIPLRRFLRRPVGKTTLEKAKRGARSQLDIASVKPGLFDPSVLDPLNPKSLRIRGGRHSNADIWVSPALPDHMPYRAFIVDGKVDGLAPAPQSESPFDAKKAQLVASEWARSGAAWCGFPPRVYALDLGVTSSGETFLIGVADPLLATWADGYPFERYLFFSALAQERIARPTSCTAASSGAFTPEEGELTESTGGDRACSSKSRSGSIGLH